MTETPRGTRYGGAPSRPHHVIDAAAPCRNEDSFQVNGNSGAFRI